MKLVFKLMTQKKKIFNKKKIQQNMMVRILNNCCYNLYIKFKIQMKKWINF